MSDREMYLGAMAGSYEGELPPPNTRSLKWMAKILGADIVTEPVQSAEEAYLEAIYENGGGGGGVTVEALTVTENGTYTAPSGKAYSPVKVNVPVGKKYATGTYTLASSSYQLSFNPGIDFTPSVVRLMKNSAVYGVDGCIGAAYTALGEFILPPAGNQKNYLYVALETRSAWEGYAAPQANNWASASVGNPSFLQSEFLFISRTNNYPFFADEYTWAAWE